MRRRASRQRPRTHKPKTAKARKALKHPPFQWKVYKGDVVGVNRGPFKGMTGEVIKTHKRRLELRVKGVNLVKRKVWDHKTDPNQPRRVWVEREEPIHYSRVQLLDPKTQELTKVDFRYLESGERVRIARASGAVVTKPIFIKPERPEHTMLASPFDTLATDVNEVTYRPRGIPDYIKDVIPGHTPRYATYPRRMRSLKKQAKAKARAKLTFQQKLEAAKQRRFDERTEARKRRFQLPEVLQHLHPPVLPPTASYLARVASVEADAALRGASGGGA